MGTLAEWAKQSTKTRSPGQTALFENVRKKYVLIYVEQCANWKVFFSPSAMFVRPVDPTYGYVCIPIALSWFAERLTRIILMIIL